MSPYWIFRLYIFLVVSLAVAAFVGAIIGVTTDSSTIGGVAGICAVACAIIFLIGGALLGCAAEEGVSFEKPVRISRADKKRLREKRSQMEMDRRIAALEKELDNG